MEPLVSVVIAAYQHPDYLNQAVESVMKQTLQDLEIIVVDDASGEEMVSKYRLPTGAKLIVQPERRRAAAARNAGMRASRGKYIALLDQDDIWLPEKLAKQVAMLEAHPDYALVFCHYTPVDEVLSPLPPERKPRYKVHNPLTMMIRGCFIRTPSTILFRRDAAVEAGLFDESVIGASDWDFYLRLARNHGFGADPEVLVMYRMHPGQMHRNEEVMLTAKFKIYDSTLAWAEMNRTDLLSLTRRYYCRVLRQAAKFKLFVQAEPDTAHKILIRAIHTWPWNVRTYGLLLRAIVAQNRERR